VNEVLLQVSGLNVAYGKIEALHGIDLRVDQGSIVTVIGPNGAGKTTLLAAIMGLLPSHGRIEYLGSPADDVPVEHRVAAGLVLVPERRELFSSMSVEDNLQLGAFVRRRHQSRAEFAAALKDVYRRFPRLEERRAQQAGTLSGGERQMLALGRALMSRPKLLLLDEPSLGLAPLIVREILQIVASLRQAGTSILLIEQNARAAMQIADYAYVLETGEIALEGPASELMHNTRVAESYLGLAGAPSQPAA
jgi:branched-chain amino acid transport system ATP-binding protein